MFESITNFVNDHWMATFSTLAILFFVRRFAMLIVGRLVRQAIRPDTYKTIAEERQREDTLISVIGASIRVGVWIIGTLLILGIFGVNIAPLLAGAGVLGVALGFGAQSLVKDFLSGVFILVENQYRVGDVVSINGTISGIVEHVSLRETALRDLDGVVHHIPNGFIDFASNMTMEYANINLDVRVSYDTDLDKLELVINRVGSELAQDKNWKDKILEAPTLLRVNKFDDTGIIVKITGATAPMKQWAITGELRKRLKKAFDAAGIEIPLPQHVVHQAKPLKAKKPTKK